MFSVLLGGMGWGDVDVNDDVFKFGDTWKKWYNTANELHAINDISQASGVGDPNYRLSSSPKQNSITLPLNLFNMYCILRGLGRGQPLSHLWLIGLILIK